MPSIHLESFRVKTLQITEELPPEGKNQSGGTGFTWATASHNSDPCKYRLTFGINNQPDPDEEEDNLPWVQLSMEAYFSFDESVPEDEREKILLVNGSSILYGIARGLLAGVSGAFGNSILLPTVDMVSIVINMIEGHKKKSATNTAPKKKATKATKKPAVKRPAKKQS